MKQYLVRLYQKEDYAIWNSFVEVAKNATFLFHRDYMEYHSDRFDDYSLLIFENDKLVSILPANRVGTTLFSHQGLTYGGLVITKKCKLIEFITIFSEVLKFLNSNAILNFNLKLLPRFYCDIFSDELEYCLHVLDAKLTQRNANSVIDLKRTFFISKSRKENIRRGLNNNLKIKEELNFDLFWNAILEPNLKNKHNSKPVHSAKEMQLLQQNFPDNIKHFNVYDKEKIVAGTTIFIAGKVIHPQYVSGNKDKNSLGSLDYLYHYLITDKYKNYDFFDFANSNEPSEKRLNKGLLFWKESFGAKTVVQNFYEVETKNYSLLENIFTK